MSNCKHEFIGNAECVKCTKCGKTMTAKEYVEALQNKAERKVKK